MRTQSQKSTLRQTKADAVAVFVAEDKNSFAESIKQLRKIFGKKIDNIVTISNFEGKEDQITEFYSERKTASPRVLLVGLGLLEKLSAERYRRAGAAAAKRASTLKLKSLAFSLAEMDAAILKKLVPYTVAIYAVIEGALLSTYRFDKYITDEKQRERSLKTMIFFDPDQEREKSLRRSFSDARIVCEAVTTARDLENAPGNEIYPETLAAAAQAAGAKYGFRVSVWDKKKIETAGFGGLLAVNAGSNRPPRFIILEYNSGRRDLDTVVLVGKGITFDAGGISIKPANGMSEMKMDMSGAAAVIGSFEAAARLKFPIHLVGLIPSTENLLGGSAMRPGDIIVHHGGKTSEVDNTDAEGRLVLADALAYASSFKPAAVIDLATLTGACVVALGHHVTGMMGNDDKVMGRIKVAGERTFERVWQLPLFEEYEKQIRSDVADVKNVGGRWAGAITAALFLKKFIGEYKWVHLDIAGTAILEEELPYTPKGGSGVGVRLLTDLLRNWEGIH